MCSYCISESRRRAATGSHPSRGGCRTCCSGSSRCAIGCQLWRVCQSSVLLRASHRLLSVGLRVPSSNAFPSSRIYGDGHISERTPGGEGESLPLHSLYTGRRHRPGRSVIRGTTAIPWRRQRRRRGGKGGVRRGERGGGGGGGDQTLYTNSFVMSSLAGTEGAREGGKGQRKRGRGVRGEGGEGEGTRPSIPIVL